MAVGTRADPYLAFRFRVDVEGLQAGGFSEVTGLQVEMQTEDYHEGGVNAYVHKLAGPASYPTNLVLRHGLTDAELLWEWCRDVMHGAIKKRNVSIVLLDSQGEEARRWEFRQAYPVRWSGPELRGDSAGVAMESLELVHQGLISVTG